MNTSTTKKFINSILPIIVVALHVITLILSCFDLEEFFFEPGITVVIWLLSVAMCFMIIKNKDVENSNGTIHCLTAIFLIIYEILYIINYLENVDPNTIPGQIANVSGVFVVPGATLVYLLFYASFKFGWISFEKCKTVYAVLAGYIVAFLIGAFCLSPIFGEIDFGSSSKGEHAHRCITCGEYEYIVEKTQGYWICDDCKGK